MNDELKTEVAEVRERLLKQLDKSADKSSLLRSDELRALYQRIAQLPEDQRSSYGEAVNDLKSELVRLVSQQSEDNEALPPLDVSAPFALNTRPERRPGLLSAEQGSKHPLSIELDIILSIFEGMGFGVVESREIDDDWHMFGSLNFPEGHPARDDYDTFMT
ncbi:MAG: hypothetical protein ACREF7_00585, partial [Candidatus Saccharimonadales bacterium]